MWVIYFILILVVIILISSSKKSSSDADFNISARERAFFNKDIKPLVDEGITIPKRIIELADRHRVHLIRVVYDYTKNVWLKINPDKEMSIGLKNQLVSFILNEKRLTSMIWDSRTCKEGTKTFIAVKNIIQGNRENYFDGIPKKDRKEIPIKKKGKRFRKKDALFYAEKKQVVSIEYQRRNKEDWKWEKTMRDIDIYFVEDGHVYAYCHFRKEPRIFHRENIISWEAKDNTFEKDVNIEKYLKARKDRQFKGNYDEWLRS